MVHPPLVAELTERVRERILEPLTLRQRDALLSGALGTLAVGLHLGFDQDNPGALVRLPDWVAIVTLVVMATLLAWRRTNPERVMSSTGLLTAAYYFTGEASPAAVVLLVFALYAVTAFGAERSEGLLSLLACWFFMTLSFVIGAGLESVVSASFVLSAFVFGVAWALGEATRTRMALTDELRRRNVQLAVLRERERDELVGEERRRIARELHDVVSHTVSVVVVQAAAARRVADSNPSAVTEALGAIEHAAREAMGELRIMLGLLREDDHQPPDLPTPDRSALHGLLDELRAAGMPVRLEGDLPADTSAGVALTIHRVVQEALTNVLRHAEDVSEVVVRIGRRPEGLKVEVIDDGRPSGFTHGTGTGLVGMRERAALHGGTIEAGPLRTGRGYRVHALVPEGVRV